LDAGRIFERLKRFQLFERRAWFDGAHRGCGIGVAFPTRLMHGVLLGRPWGGTTPTGKKQRERGRGQLQIQSFVRTDPLLTTGMWSAADHKRRFAY
jgi:hypothetical protein